MEDYRAAAQADPNRPGFPLSQAFLLLRLGRGPEAQAAAEKALAFNPTLPDILQGYALIMIVTGKAGRRGGGPGQGDPTAGTPIYLSSLWTRRAGCWAITRENPGKRGGRIRLALAAVEHEAGPVRGGGAAHHGRP